MSKPTPEDISVILGRIRYQAELIVERFQASTMPDPIVEDVINAQRILELVEQAQKVVLEAQLSASIKARS